MVLADAKPEYVRDTAPIGLEMDVEVRTVALIITEFCLRSITDALKTGVL